MWAEITIRCKNDLPANLHSGLQSRFDSRTDTLAAINSTFLKDNAAIACLVIYAQISSSRVFLIFQPESRTLKTYVEALIKKDSLRGLKREIEGVVRELDDFLKLYNNKSKHVQIVIGGSHDEIMNGERTHWTSRVKRLLLEDVVIKLIIPVVTYIISTMTHQDQEKSLVNAIIALVSLLLFAFAKSFSAPKFEYREV